MNRVLLVDDEPAITRSLRRALRRESYEVLTASSAAEALSLVEEHTVDVVVSDERMPDMSGSELLTALRRERPDIVRIILSGQASMSATLRAINDAEVFRFLTKPCSPSILAACIADGLRARESRSRSRDADRQRCELTRAFDRAMATVALAVQPIVDAAAGRAVAYEALARPSEPRLPHPGALFAAAEQLDRVFELEARLRALAADIAARLPGESLLFVNVHPSSLEDPALYRLESPLSRHADRVVLEITERASLAGIADAVARIDQLRALGYRVAVDDLGAGYAGLTSLVKLQPDVVKFDMELVRHVDTSHTHRVLLASMVTVCRDLGITTVAEGVETEAERQTLQALECDLLQGFLIARPAAPFPPVRPQTEARPRRAAHPLLAARHLRPG